MYKYKIRCFYSKGAFLVMIWTLFISTVLCSLSYNIEITLRSVYLSYWWLGFPLAVIAIVAILSGMLADIKFGKYKVLKAGFILLFISTLLNCLTILLITLIPPLKYHSAFEITNFSLVAVLAIAGGMMSMVSILQLGLDQMPDASVSSITSFIAWFVFNMFFGFWIKDVLSVVENHCLDNHITPNFTLVWSFLLAFLMGCILVSDILLAQKWLIMEPKSSHAVRTIFQVLKFAARYKAPLNRSAFTYWEEDIPSRLDLGKSKYGGPFSTEQVEDVKTVLRLLLVSLSLWFTTFAVRLDPPLNKMPTIFLNFCSESVLMKFTYDTNLWILLATLIHEFFVYPILRDKLPTILKKIGSAAFISAITSLLCLILDIINNSLLHSPLTALNWTTAVLYSVMTGVSVQVLVTSIVELVYAQSPCNIRGLFTGYLFLVLILSVLLGQAVINGLHSLFIALSVKTSVCLIAFILHCILAHWYKGRVRDEVYATHRVVEEIYERYLSYSD